MVMICDLFFHLASHPWKPAPAPHGLHLAHELLLVPAPHHLHYLLHLMRVLMYQ